MIKALSTQLAMETSHPKIFNEIILAYHIQSTVCAVCQTTLVKSKKHYGIASVAQQHFFLCKTKVGACPHHSSVPPYSLHLLCIQRPFLALGSNLDVADLNKSKGFVFFYEGCCIKRKKVRERGRETHKEEEIFLERERGEKSSLLERIWENT